MIISVVTPSYNQGRFLAETIRSVISQAGAFFLDYIIIDGGSTDDSVHVIESFDSLLRNGDWPVRCEGISLRWISEKDRGQTDAMIKGFAMANGEILAWLNSDDTYLPGTLQAALDQFMNDPELALLYGDAQYCDPGGAVIGGYRTRPFDFDKLALYNFICQPAAFFRKGPFEAVGGLDHSLHYAMDYDLWIKIGRQFPCRYLPRLFARYRLHESSKTVSSDTLVDNSEEALRLAIKHFGWAPFNRVYTACNALCGSSLAPRLASCRPVLVIASLICSVVRSLWLNGGLSGKDLQLLSRENLRKLFKSRIELMTGKK